MRMRVKSTTGKECVIEFDQHSNIREIKTKMARSFFPKEEGKETRDYIPLIREILLSDKSRNICTLYIDDDADMTIADFLKMEFNHPHYVVGDLDAIVYHDVSFENHRRTLYNPKGEVPERNILGTALAEMPFWQSWFNPQEFESFSERLQNINYSFENIPNKYLDPITMVVMEKPYITTEEETYDVSTLIKINYQHPVTRRPIHIKCANIRLRAELEDFVVAQEKNHARDSLESKKDFNKKENLPFDPYLIIKITQDKLHPACNMQDFSTYKKSIKLRDRSNLHLVFTDDKTFKTIFFNDHQSFRSNKCMLICISATSENLIEDFKKLMQEVNYANFRQDPNHCLKLLMITGINDKTNIPEALKMKLEGLAKNANYHYTEVSSQNLSEIAIEVTAFIQQHVVMKAKTSLPVLKPV
jgi:hypothetical protein